jgi:hypothetical protein
MFAQAVFSGTITLLICFLAFKIFRRYTVASFSSGKLPPRHRNPIRHGAAPSVDLRQVYPGINEAVETEFDIIAIHGLDTKSPDTWTWRDPEDSKGAGVNWLSDLLPRKFPKARIFTCDWPADIFRTKDTIESTTEELARKLLLGIKARDIPTEDRPILFIASCLGGLVLNQALVLAEKQESGYTAVWEATKGIIFLATPFRGTAFEQVARKAVFFLNGYAKLSKKQVTNLLSSTTTSSLFLQELVGNSTTTYQQRKDDCRLAIFYETKKGNLLRKVLPHWLADVLNEPRQVCAKRARSRACDSYNG